MNIKAPQQWAMLAVFSTFGAAQAAPNAGQLLQQIETERTLQQRAQVLPKIEAEQQTLVPTGDVEITVNSFQFTGNTLIHSDELSLVVARYLNQPLDFIGLQKVSSVIADYYRKLGWVVRAYLPKQDVTDGIVTIHIVEAVLGGVELKGDASRMSEADLLERVASVQAIGDYLDANKVDRALLLIDDLPGVTARGSLSKGQGSSETDLVMTVADQPLFQAEIGGDNTGPRSTGNERMTANLYLNSPLKIGDQLTANFIHSQGNDYGRLAYSLPIGNDGFRLGINSSYLSYNLIGDFSSLNALGHSSTVGLEASYPLVRSRIKNLYIGLNADHKGFYNEANSNITTEYQINSLSLSLKGNLFDKLGGGGASNAALTVTRGDNDLGTIDLAENTVLDGRFTKLNYNISRHQVLSSKVSAYLGLRGQEASNKLDSAEKFYLGGQYGVRAYPTNEGSGSDGQLLNLELRARLSHNLMLVSFYDYGHVSETGIASLNNYSLEGAGLSVAWTIASSVNLKATWARRIGNNPNKLASGHDQDGSLRKDRFWLQASMSF